MTTYQALGTLAISTPLAIYVVWGTITLATERVRQFVREEDALTHAELDALIAEINARNTDIW